MHTLEQAEERSGYAVFICSAASRLRFFIWKTIMRCPVCGQRYPLD